MFLLLSLYFHLYFSFCFFLFHERKEITHKGGSQGIYLCKFR